MANSGSFSTSQCAPAGRTWYWDFSWWVTSWSGNTATIHYEVYNRCTSGTSGETWIANYGFNGSIAGHNFSSNSSFYKDSKIAEGNFTLSGGTYFEAWVTAHPYTSSATSSGSGGWTLDNNVVTPTVTCAINSRTETTMTVSMAVTNNGNASIVDRYIDLFTNSNCSDASKVAVATNPANNQYTFTGLSPNTTYYARANAGNGTYRGYSGVPSSTTYKYPYLTSCSDFTIGNNVTLRFYNPLKRTIELQMWSHNSQTFINSTKVSCTPNDNTNYTFPASNYNSNLYASIPATTESKYNIDVWYNGNKAVGDMGKKYKVSGNNNQAPTFTNFDYKDTDSLGSQLTGKNGVNNPGVLVAGLSDCTFNITTSQKATSNYGATLDHYNFAWPNGVGKSANYSSSNAVTAKVTDGNTGTISVTAYDKRGQYKTVSKSITLISPSHATGNLRTTRRNGIEAITYLNGSISYWAGDWNNGSSRPNNFYRVEYTINGGSTYYDITNAVKSNSSTSTSGKIKTFNLNANTIQIHANGSSGGFVIGTQYKIQVYVITGVQNGSTYYNYDNRQKVADIVVNSGTFGMSRYKADGRYYYGINCLPIPYGGGPRAFTVRGPSEQIVAQSDNSSAALGFGIGAGGVNRGIFDLTPVEDGGVNKWLIYYNNTRMICSTELFVDGKISVNKDTATYLNGNKGINVCLNNENNSGTAFKMLARTKSTNGVFMFGSYGKEFNVYYTNDSTISAGTNGVTKTLKLLNEDGNSEFPGTIKIKDSILNTNGNAPSYTIRAWGYGTASSSGASLVAHNNLSSVSRVSQGAYQVNFWNAMPHANYAVAVSAEVSGMGVEIIGVYSRSTTGFRFDVCSPSGVAQDPSQWSIMVSC